MQLYWLFVNSYIHVLVYMIYFTIVLHLYTIHFHKCMSNLTTTNCCHAKDTCKNNGLLQLMNVNHCSQHMQSGMVVPEQRRPSVRVLLMSLADPKEATGSLEK